MSARDPLRIVHTVDVVITDSEGRILVMLRGTEPFKHTWVLPGGIVDPGETYEQAALREAREEVGLGLRIVRAIGVYDAPGRDPRGRFVSHAFHTEVIEGTPTTTEEAHEIRWVDPTDLPPMGFDHASIVADFLRTA